MIKNKRPSEDISDVGGQPTQLAYKEFDSKLNDVLYMRLANGGGYGDPLERDPQLVLKDVIDGIVSTQAAQEIYGVALKENEQTIDLTATENLRRTRQAGQPTPKDVKPVT